MAPLPFQIISDLHLETQRSYSQFKLKQTAPYLALLGDIGYVSDPDLFTFIEAQIKRYWAVFFVLGNHEPYGLSFPAARVRMRAFAEKMEKLRRKSTMGRFVLLDKGRHDLNEGLTVLGCTLFSGVRREQAKEVGERLSDFRYIQDWTVEDHFRAHEEELAWLNGQVGEIEEREPNRQIVIFTHHCPTVAQEATDPLHEKSTIGSGFATDLSEEKCWTAKQVRMWAFGHTHYNCQFMEKGTGKRIVANQRGYAMTARERFDATRVFLVGGEEAAAEDEVEIAERN